ncbi:MAG TPA: hypothetical protein VHW44_09345 [Pseudonocardiaceae bacterium]|jgi:hypothetical protein|nr:hypothetical protein [Pseudonocardiaceae bacterium]
MTGRVLRIELRRSSVLVSGAALLVIGLVLLYGAVANGQGEVWDRRWVELALVQRFALLLLWPLALGAGGWLARRDRRAGMEELLSSTSRPGWQRRTATAGALAIALVVAYFLLLALGAVRIATTTGFDGLGWLPIAVVGALSVVAAGWLGLAIGRLVPSVLTPPLLVVFGLVAIGTVTEVVKYAQPGQWTNAVNLLAPTLTTAPDDFTTVAPNVNLLQGLWFLALAATGIGVLAASRPGHRLLAGIPAVLGLALVLPLLPRSPAAVFVTDPTATALVCAQGSPHVCVTRADRADLAEVTAAARRALPLLAVLPDPPSALQEIPEDPSSIPAHPQPTDMVWFDSENLAGPHDEDDLVLRMLAGGGTRPCGDPIARSVVADWLLDQGHTPPAAASAPEVWQTWRQLVALPPAEQLRRVAAVRAAALTCHGDLLSTLTGGAQ